MSSRPTSTSGRRAPRQLEPEDSYPNIPQPRQSHTGNMLAILSVFAILAFGAWTAIGTLTGAGDRPATRAEAVPTTAPTRAAAAVPAPTTAPTSAPSPAGTPSPGGTPARAATPGPGGTRVHTVGSGDTLTRIAAQYGTTVDAIMAANGFTERSKVLHVGDKLNIP